jgi:hypothetical protein
MYNDRLDDDLKLSKEDAIELFESFHKLIIPDSPYMRAVYVNPDYLEVISNIFQEMESLYLNGLQRLFSMDESPPIEVIRV